MITDLANKTIQHKKALDEAIKEMGKISNERALLVESMNNPPIDEKAIQEQISSINKRLDKIKTSFSAFAGFKDELGDMEWLLRLPIPTPETAGMLLAINEANTALEFVTRETAKAYNRRVLASNVNGTECGFAFYNEISSPKDTPEPETITSPLFFKVIQGPATNALTEAQTSNLSHQLDMLGNAEIKVSDNFTLRIKNYAALKNGIPTTAYMLFHCLLIHYTEQPIKDTRVRLPLTKYMEMRGLSDKKSARAQVLSDINALKLIEYEAREKIKGKWVHSGSIAIYGGTGLIRNGIIHFNFNADFYSALQRYSIMEYSRDTLKVNPQRQPHAFYFSHYLDVNYRMNEGKERVSTIRIATLISKAPQLPSYDEIMASPSRKGNVYKHIILPVIRDLDSIERLFYEFIGNDGITISDPYEYFKGTGGYEKFISAKIKVDYSDYQRHDNRITRRKKHTEKARAIKQGKRKSKELEARIEALEQGGNGTVSGG